MKPKLRNFAGLFLFLVLLSSASLGQGNATVTVTPVLRPEKFPTFYEIAVNFYGDSPCAKREPFDIDNKFVVEIAGYGADDGRSLFTCVNESFVARLSAREFEKIPDGSEISLIEFRGKAPSVSRLGNIRKKEPGSLEAQSFPFALPIPPGVIKLRRLENAVEIKLENIPVFPTMNCCGTAAFIDGYDPGPDVLVLFTCDTPTCIAHIPNDDFARIPNGAKSRVSFAGSDQRTFVVGRLDKMKLLEN